MLNKRFDIFEFKKCEQVLNRLKELFENGKKDLIEKEFENKTNYVWDCNGNFLDPNDTEGSLDVLVMELDDTHKDVILYISGDISKTTISICYLVRNNNCNVIEIANVSTIEELVNQLFKELNFVEYYHTLFEDLNNNLSKVDLSELNDKYETTINGDYFFENFIYFRAGYMNEDNLIFNAIKMQSITKDIFELLKNK